MKLSTVLSVFCLAFLLLAGAGCVSGSRALRSSPAGKEMEIRFDRETVNLWPLYYHCDDLTSVLWPFFDLDSRGFAVRPFYHQDQDSAAVLWPLSGWDANGGWALSAYWGRGACGMFPLFHTGNFHYIGPFVWRTGPHRYFFLFPAAYWKSGRVWFAGPVWRSGEEFGLFPVAWHVPPFQLYGPVWWNSGSGNFGLFPLSWKLDDFQLHGPVWWNSENGSFGVFPAVWRLREFCMAGPVWWNSGNGNFGLFPLSWKLGDFQLHGPVWWNSESGSFGVFPVVWKLREFFMAGPVWWNSGGGEFGVFPLFGCYPERLRQFGPVWWQNRNETLRHGFFPIYYCTSGPEKFEIGLLELFHQERTDKRLLWRALLGLIRYESREGSVRRWQVWPLVSWSRYSPFPPSPILQIRRFESGERATVLPNNGYTPFGRSFTDGRKVRCVTLEDEKSYFGTLLAFQESGVSRIWRPEADGNTLDQLRQALIRLERALAARNSGGRGEQEKKQRETVASEQRKIAEYAASLAIEMPPPETAEAVAAWRELLVKRFCTEVDFAEHRTLCGLTSWYERFGDRYWGQFGLGSVIVRREGDRSDLRILGFFYREKHDGESSEYLYPPFLSVKRSPGRTHWSFLYRVFSWRNDNGRRSGHILFIPWGDSER